MAQIRLKTVLMLLSAILVFGCGSDAKPGNDDPTSTPVNSDPGSGVVKGSDEKKSDTTTTDSAKNQSKPN